MSRYVRVCHLYDELLLPVDIIITINNSNNDIFGSAKTDFKTNWPISGCANTKCCPGPQTLTSHPLVHSDHTLGRGTGSQQSRIFQDIPFSALMSHVPADTLQGRSMSRFYSAPQAPYMLRHIRLPVRPSHSGIVSKTKERRGMRSSPPGSPVSLVF